MSRVFVSCWLLPLALCLLVAPVYAQQPVSQVVPITDRAYNDVNVMQRAGIVISPYGEGTVSSRRLCTREQFAVGIARLLVVMHGPYGPEFTDRLRLDLPALDALDHLVQEFQPELPALGQDVPAVQACLTSLAAGRSPTVAPPFPDVPKDHWAYSFVEALRKAGIIVGEPGNG